MSEPVLVLIHGFPFDHTMWDPVTALLDPQPRVLAPDLRGFGEQPAGDDEPSIDLMADDVAKFLDQQNISRAVVAGMSMGGYVALSFAQYHKDRLAALGLISTQTIADTAEIHASRLALAQQVRREGPAAAVQAVLPKLFAPQNSDKPELVRFPLQAAERAGVSGIGWALEAMAHRPDRSEFVKSLQIPVLVVHGAKDKLIPPRRAREMAGSIPNARFIQIAQAGHCTPLERPKEVAKALSLLVAESYRSIPVLV